MSGGFERIIRPFETSDIGPPKPAPSSEGAASAPQNTVINPGKNGQVKTFSGSYNITITYYYVKKPKEKKKAPA